MMNTILTDDDIALLPGLTFREIARSAEAAVLAKLRAQEPLFYYRLTCNGEMCEGPIWGKSARAQALMAASPPSDWKPLYPAPQPAVVQVPQGWRDAVMKAADELDMEWQMVEGIFHGLLPSFMADKNEAGFVTIPIDSLIESDSYGVQGSDFYRCKVCGAESGAGVLNKGIQHSHNCPLAAAPEAPAQVPQGIDLDALLNRFAQACAFGDDQARRVEAANAIKALFAAAAPEAPALPIDMTLHCPACGMQHIDAPEWVDDSIPLHAMAEVLGDRWDNPPHRSHLCHGCGHIWRPADVPTNGVAAIKTKGKADSPAPEAQEIADVWHEGSQSFYRAVLLKKLTLDEVFLDPAGSPEAPATAVVQVPQGWKLVPVEPGDWVFADKVLGHDSHPNHKERMRRLYRAMLAAAPEAPALPAEVREALKVAREALAGFIAITSDSRGVAGYHLNGDTAEWDEFDEVDAASAALARLDALGGVG